MQAGFQAKLWVEERKKSFFSPTSVYVPVLHAGELGGGLLEIVMVAVGEGAQAARYQRHCAEPGAGLAGRVRAGGILLVVLAVTRGFQPMVGARKGHLHDCWRSRTARVSVRLVTGLTLRLRGLRSVLAGPGGCC